MKIIITFGTFDLFHYGHVQILQRARELGDRLVVGVSTDEFNMKKKGKTPVFSFEHRKAIVESLKCVDEVFPEESMEKKREYIEKYKADVLVMGDDWVGAFDGLAPTVVYLERTPTISTTYYKNNISSNNSNNV
jgi:glycerol-3-phosphate cytidylyltransferase